MAGHSKWSNIKHRKAAQDAQRGRAFTRVIAEISTAARIGGGNPADNPRLRLALDKASAANIPKTTVQRAIARSSGSLKDSNLQECVYEGYGPGGVAIMIEACTDNRNRTIADIRHAFSQSNSSLGTGGSVAYLFNKIGRVQLETADEEAVMDVAESAGAEDIEELECGFMLTCAASALKTLIAASETRELNIAEAALIQEPSMRIEVTDEESEQLAFLLEKLSELDDVQAIYTNSGHAAQNLASEG
ncbi:MAG: YebC/PmpR family DNA-binding transcriptional regulator [Gammaproteobacteria bacterium]